MTAIKIRANLVTLYNKREEVSLCTRVTFVRSGESKILKPEISKGLKQLPQPVSHLQTSTVIQRLHRLLPKTTHCLSSSSGREESNS